MRREQAEEKDWTDNLPLDVPWSSERPEEGGTPWTCVPSVNPASATSNGVHRWCAGLLPVRKCMSIVGDVENMGK